MSSARSSTRRIPVTGLLVAAGFALIAAGVVIYVAIASRQGLQGPAVPSNVVDIGKAPEGDKDSAQAMQDGRLQFADKRDPSRLASELIVEKLDPVGQGYYALTQPRAWVYLRDGRIMHIRADSGRIKMPSRTEQPESGEFRGTVVVRIYPSPEERGTKDPINPERDTPVLLARTESASFDSLMMEVQTQDLFTLSTPQVFFEGQGLLVRGNQVRERIELLKTAGRVLKYNPTIRTAKNQKPLAPTGTPKGGTGKSKPSEPALAASAPLVPPPASAAPQPASPAAAKETLYRVLFSDDVQVTETTRLLKADTLELFARTINNAFPENAFGAWAEEAGKTSDAVAAKPAPASKPESAPHVAAATPETPKPAAAPDPYAPIFVDAGDKNIVMTWTGSLVMSPITADAPPTELAAGNHFAARFSADKPGKEPLVSMTDRQSGARAECAAIEYAATTRMLALLTGPNAKDVIVSSPDSGRMTVPNFKINLGTGVSHIAGAGTIASFKDVGATGAANVAEAAAGSQITWTDQADLDFRVENGRIVAALDEARFTGGVLAKDSVSLIAGDYLQAKFTPAGKQLSALRHVHADGNVVAVAGARDDTKNVREHPPLDPYLIADKLDVGFELSKADPNQTEPARAVATGAVKASTTDAWIHAGRLEAALGRDAKNNFTATDLVATGDVQFERTDGVMARADRLQADPVKRIADLTGEIVALGRDSTTIRGRQVRLDEGKSTLLVHGAGAFEHEQPSSSTPANGQPAEPTRITATWSRSMKFDNLGGVIECDGDTTVTAAAPLSTQTSRSNRLRLFITPEGQTSAPTSNASLALTGDRRLLRAEAIGEVIDVENGRPAEVEVRNYALRPTTDHVVTERVLDQVMYIEGPTIIADDEKGTVTVPAAGRAIVRDQRGAGTEPAANANGGASSPALVPTSSRGTSRFVWAESMEFTRATGTIVMKKDVELTHLALGSSQAVRLVAAQLDATFNIAGSQNADLSKAVAHGSVYAESGSQKLLADKFIYDAINSTAEAIAEGDNSITLYDEKKGPVTARKVIWDLKADRIEVSEPSPVTTIR